jgi:hypothetical protein
MRREREFRRIMLHAIGLWQNVHFTGLCGREFSCGESVAEVGRAQNRGFGRVKKRFVTGRDER